MQVDDSEDQAESRSAAPQRPRKHPNKDGKGRNRPRASLACLNCRERKTKCTKTNDPNTCASCQALHIPCVISHLGDRRRIQSREQFIELQDRVHQLENLLILSEQTRRQGTVPRTTPPIEEANGGEQGLPNTNAASSENAGAETISDGQATEHEPQLDSFTIPGDEQYNSTEHIGPTDWPMDLGSANAGDNGAISRIQPDQRRYSVSFPMHRSPDSLTMSTEDDAPRLDFDQEKGQSRFYGPTSQLHIRSSSQSVPNDVENNATTAPMAEIKTDSARVKEILLQSYWESQPLSQALIERKRFEVGRKAAVRSEYWSAFLENALLACASRMRTSPDIRALGPHYCERATLRIIEELQSPQIATIQGFLLLSDFEATRGRDRLGYLYCGIGCRMIFDLGLHESCTALVAQGRLTETDKVSRHLLFLGAYCYDTLWGLYLGRPSNIPIAMLQTAQSRVDDLQWSVPTSLEAWVGLATEIAEVTEVLNNNAVPLDPAAMGRLADLDARISRRTQSLPAELSFQADQISELAVDAYGLQVQLRGIRIVLHKRLSQTYNANAGQSLAPGGHGLARSRAVMHESAIMIARLTSTYQRIFGIENVITVMLDNIFVAAASLVSHILNIQRTEIQQSTDSDVAWLCCLSDMFQRAQKHYPVTARMLSTLSNLVQNTSMAGIFGERTHSKPSGGQMLVPPNDLVGDTDWSLGLSLDSGQPDGQVDSSNWFLNGLGDTSMSTAPDMDPRNMMTWLLSPMEEI